MIGCWSRGAAKACMVPRCHGHAIKKRLVLRVRSGTWRRDVRQIPTLQDCMQGTGGSRGATCCAET
eukprot:136227-Pyramimonas_sp.AAC.1